MAINALDMGQTPQKPAAAPTGPTPGTPREPVKPAATPGAATAAKEAPAGVGLRISLMPSDLEGGKRPDLTKRVLVLVLVLVVETLVFGGIHLYLSRLASDRIAEGVKLEAEQKQQAVEIAEEEKMMAEALTFNRQVAAVSDTLERHIYWNGMLSWLETHTRPNVIYYNLNANADTGLVVVDARGKDYRDLAEQIIMFREDPAVLKLSHSAASLSMSKDGKVDGAVMSFSLKLKPDVWKLAASGATPPAANETAPAATSPVPANPSAVTPTAP
ncbi:MAG: hypothetical protein PHT12_03325 [Patescibacteria group bacterium]|nr:hypothetical protein [Patescibacteria group bacterium]